MSKSLEALEHLVDGNLNEVNYYRQFCDSTTYIMKDKETIEKELKALKIIKSLPQEEKEILLNAIYTHTKSEEKYNALKEVLL